MQTITFYLYDIQYKVEAGKAVIHLYGRTREGQQICVLDRHVEPYFVVEPHIGEDPAPAITKIISEEHRVVTVEPFTAKILGVEKQLLRVYVNLPKAVPQIKDIVKSLPGVAEVYEYDILFTKRYLIDKQLTPLTLVQAKGTFVPHSSKVPVFEASEIAQGEDKTPERPRALAVDIETYNPDGKVMDMNTYPILMIALHGDDFSRVITWKKITHPTIHIEHVESEEAMLERFAHHISDYKPDLLLGYHSDGFDLPYIHARARKHKINLPLGLDHSEMDVVTKGNRRVEITGLVHIDVLPFLRRVIGRTMETDSFTLENVSQELLGEGKVDIDVDKLWYHWDHLTPEISRFAEYNLKDAELTLRLFHKIWPNIVEMTKIVGQPLFDIVRMSFSQYVEWYIIKQAVLAHEIVLNKPRYSESGERMGHRAVGGFVREPKPGLYDRLAVFDFRSLYPSIIISHNISTDTINCACCKGKQQAPVEGQDLWFCTKKKGFLSTVLKEVVDKRAAIKKQLKTDPKNPLLAARSEGLKVMANAFYGYLGFAPARWYSHECVESITAFGRSYINTVMHKAEDKGFLVVYGDTDSVFLQITESSTEKDALAFMDAINKTLPGVMELEFVDLYPAGIFVATKGSDVGAKKRYALINKRGELTVKGFEIVRRNFSELGKNIQYTVLQILLSEKNPEKAMKYVRDMINKLKKGDIPVNDLAISTQITKPIGEYDNVGPHVAAAKLMAEKKQPVGPGTIVRYVVIKGAGKIRDKVRLPPDTKPSDVDADYYINHQIIPAIENIFAVFGIGHDHLVKESNQSSLSGFF